MFLTSYFSVGNSAATDKISSSDCSVAITGLRVSSLRKGRLDNRSRTKGTVGPKVQQDKSLIASFSKVIPSLKM